MEKFIKEFKKFNKLFSKELDNNDDFEGYSIEDILYAFDIYLCDKNSKLDRDKKMEKK